MSPYRSSPKPGLPWPHCAPKASRWRLAKAWAVGTVESWARRTRYHAIAVHVGWAEFYRILRIQSRAEFSRWEARKK